MNNNEEKIIGVDTASTQDQSTNVTISKNDELHLSEDVLDDMENAAINSVKDSIPLELLGFESKEENIEAEDTFDNPTEVKPSTEFGEKELREMGLDEETVQSLKDIPVDTSNLDPKNIKETKRNYLDVFKAYDINDDDALKLMQMIDQYKNGKTTNLYDNLPIAIQKIADGLRMEAAGVMKTSKDSAAKILLDNIINDAKFAKAIDEYQAEMSDLLLESDINFKKIIEGSINEVFDNIDKIREENPDVADKIVQIREAFNDAASFRRLYEYLDKVKMKQFLKNVERFNYQCDYFDRKTINKFDVRVPRISQATEILHSLLSDYDLKEIKKFITLLIMSIQQTSMDDVVDVAYVYRLVGNICIYNFANAISLFKENQEAVKYFAVIEDLIKKINSKENEYNEFRSNSDKTKLSMQPSAKTSASGVHSTATSTTVSS